MTSSSRRDATRSPWVARALRHEVYAQPRGISQASRKYTGVTRNAEADQSCDVCGESLVYDPVTGLGGPYSDHDDDPTLDPAYPGVTPVCDVCDEPDGPGSPDWNGETGCHVTCEQDTGRYYSDGSRV
jgi:hypothetical protein